MRFLISKDSLILNELSKNLVIMKQKGSVLLGTCEIEIEKRFPTPWVDSVPAFFAIPFLFNDHASKHTHDMRDVTLIDFQFFFL